VTATETAAPAGAARAWWVLRAGPPLAVAAAAGATAAYVALVDPNQPGHYPACPFLALTGLYCPGCGALRAVHALSRGDLETAASLNVLVVAAVPLLVALWSGWARRRWTGAPRTWLAPGWLLWALLAVVLGFAVLRNLPAVAWLAP
jgi:hypothetical protein